MYDIAVTSIKAIKIDVTQSAIESTFTNNLLFVSA
jgi:hypothetical protein